MGKILGGYLFPHPPIIIEDIGQGEEKKALNTIKGVKALAKDIGDKSPETIIIITPHGPLFSDAISISMEDELKGDFGRFGYWDIKFEYKNNKKLAYKIIKNALNENINMAQVNKEFAREYNIDLDLDHGALVPLYFVDKELGDFKIIHITYGLLPPKDLYIFGRGIQKAVEESNEKVVIIASGDLSHKLSDSGPYSYSQYGPEFDKRIMEILKTGDMESLMTMDLELSERAGECGLRSLMIMSGCLDKKELRSEVFSYEGPFGVGYGTAKLEVIGESQEDILSKVHCQEESRIKDIRENEDEYVKLARMSLEYYVRTGEYLELPKGLSKELLENRRPVFVTIKKNGMLRGCIGSTEPREKNIGREIIKYAVNAGTKDPRFDRVDPTELNKLEYSVDVLFAPEPINSMNQLDVGRYGVIVSKGYKTGLLLPNIEGVDSVEDQVEIALRKAGIMEYEDYEMERFEVIRHH